MVTPTNTVLKVIFSDKFSKPGNFFLFKYMAISELFVGLVPLPWNFFYHTLRCPLVKIIGLKNEK